jgi:hypothetical protein
MLKAMVDDETPASPSRRLRAFHFESACLGLLAAALGLSSACGGSASSNAVVGGETHFLSRCLLTCDQGLACLEGICSAACAVDELTACDAFQGARCREAAHLGAGVCDVACTLDLECQSRGDGFSCDGGYCRGPVLLSSNVPDAAAPTIDLAQCASYRDQPGQAAVSVVIVNERSEPIYVDSPDGCQAQPRYVAFDRPVLFADARQRCDSRWCEQIQDEGYEPDPCPGDCASPALLRLEPGARFQVGVFRSEGVWHGASSAGETPRMPEACFERRIEPPSTAGIECTQEVPMAGSYALGASAFTQLDCSPNDDCNCAPSADGYCVTNTSNGLGSINASASLTLPASTLEVTFR